MNIFQIFIGPSDYGSSYDCFLTVLGVSVGTSRKHFYGWAFVISIEWPRFRKYWALWK